ncbi:MAG: rplT [Geminicoccaceae bacterium]|nr:rplT [Geminicoccaceae bacterium]
MSAQPHRDASGASPQEGGPVARSSTRAPKIRAHDHSPSGRGGGVAARRARPHFRVHHRRRRSDGYYTVWRFTLGPTRVDDLERELKLDTQLIRYIVLSWEPTPIDPRAVEAAEIAAEDAAAAAYAAAQIAAAAAEDDAAEAYAASQAAAATPEPEAGEATSAIEPVSAEEARAEVLDAAEAAVDTSMRLAAEEIRTDELTAEAEALEATGAELAVEPVTAIAEREQLETDAAAALEMAGTAAAAAAAVEAAEADAAADVPEGAVRGDGTGECPEDYPIKGNATSKLYHSPGSPSYKRTVPEFCFATTEAAEAAGFNPTKYEAAHDDGE